MSKGYDIMSKVIYLQNRKNKVDYGGKFMIKPEIMAKYALEKNKITDVPVNPIDIARKEGIAVKGINMDELFSVENDVLGIIRKDKTGKITIIVDNEIDGKDIRFTVAHELGHYFLNHLSEDNNHHIVEFHRSTTDHTDENEIAATKFASALLMEEKNIKSKFKILKDAEFTKEQILVVLGKFFGVKDEVVDNRLRDLELI